MLSCPRSVLQHLAPAQCCHDGCEGAADEGATGPPAVGGSAGQWRDPHAGIQVPPYIYPGISRGFFVCLFVFLEALSIRVGQPLWPFRICWESTDFSHMTSLLSSLLFPYLSPLAPPSLPPSLLRQYLPSYHPTYITHLIKTAKLRRILGSTTHLEASVKELQEACKLIPLTFGSESPLFGEVMEMMKDSHAELGRRRT